MLGAAHGRAWVTPLAVFCLMIGCGENIEEPDITAGLLTEDGWALFEAGRFVEAAVRFSQAVRLDTTSADAHNGRGWSFLKLDSLEMATSHFEEALAQGFSGADPFAGQAVALRDLGPVDFRRVIVSADSALARDPRFVFLHAPSFDWQAWNRETPSTLARQHSSETCWPRSKI